MDPHWTAFLEKFAARKQGVYTMREALLAAARIEYRRRLLFEAYFAFA